MNFNRRYEIMNDLADKLLEELGLRELQRKFKSSTVYSAFQVKNPECIVFASSANISALEKIDSALKERLDNLCQTRNVSWTSRFESTKETGQYSITYTLSPSEKLI